MFAFCIYLLAGLLAAAHLSLLILLGAWGAPVHFLEHVAFAGSLLMIASAGITLIKLPAGSRLALVAALVQWAFYLPALRQLAHASWRTTRPAPLVLVILALTGVALASVHSALTILGIARPKWMFAPATAKNRTILSVGMSALTLLAITAGVVTSRRMAQRFTFMFPANYNGWVRVDFDVPGAPSLPKRGGVYVIEVPPTGVLRTATNFDYKHAIAQYQYGGQSASPAMVSAGFAIAHQGGSDPTVREYLFVGSAQEHQSLRMMNRRRTGYRGPVQSRKS